MRSKETRNMFKQNAKVKKKAAGKASAKITKTKAKSASAKRVKRVYFFGNDRAEGNAGMKDLLGGKGANLADMTLVPLPVPAGCTITPDTCGDYNDAGQKLPRGLMEEVRANIAKVEAATGNASGHLKDPFLGPARTGAKFAMPGMMDTVLNIGLGDAAVKGLARLTGNERFAYDSYRRLINMFGDTVMGVDHEHFEHELSAVKNARGVKLDTDLATEGLKEVVKRYKAVYKKHVGEDFPQDPYIQVQHSIEAVFKSWMGDRAIKYRQLNDIRGLRGTAVNVQSMVFGNMGDDSATGVAFTRNPSTGENKFYGEFLINAQGEDVVAGIRTPIPCEQMGQWSKKSWKELLAIKDVLEARYKDVQDFEYTIETDNLYMLKTRNGKRTTAAAVKIAVDMVKEKLIEEKTAVLRVDPASLDQLLHPTFNPKAAKHAIARGLPASPGAAVGKIAFTAEEAEQRVAAGEQIILVRRETEPADIGGMHVSEGILTSTGGITSHAAVVARGMGTPCVAGAGALQIDARSKTLTVSGKAYGINDWISLDGGVGEVYEGQVETQEASLSGAFRQIMLWADKYRKLKVRTNADTPHDAQVARNFGAEGIGLTRTEHMFFDPQRIHNMREMILAKNIEERRAALAKLLPYQREDFVGIFKEMKGLPVTIRLLDPPLHEFLPHNEKDQAELARSLGKTLDEVKNRVQQLHEANPMLGHRGDRLAVTYPEILEMQLRAIIEAAGECKKLKISVLPEIMIPLAGTKAEPDYLKKLTGAPADAVMAGQNPKVENTYGTRLQMPRPAGTAGEM